jgi:hypothetical protein
VKEATHDGSDHDPAVPSLRQRLFDKVWARTQQQASEVSVSGVWKAELGKPLLSGLPSGDRAVNPESLSEVDYLKLFLWLWFVAMYLSLLLN